MNLYKKVTDFNFFKISKTYRVEYFETRNNPCMNKFLKKIIKNKNMTFVNAVTKLDYKIIPKLTYGLLIEKFATQLAR